MHKSAVVFICLSLDYWVLHKNVLPKLQLLSVFKNFLMSWERLKSCSKLAKELMGWVIYIYIYIYMYKFKDELGMILLDNIYKSIILLWVRMDLGVMTMKGHFTFLRAPEQKPHHLMQFSVILMTFLQGIQIPVSVVGLFDLLWECSMCDN